MFLVLCNCWKVKNRTWRQENYCQLFSWLYYKYRKKKPITWLMFPNMEGIAASYTQQPMHNGEFGVIMMRWADLISSLVGRKPWGWWEWLKAKCCWNGVQVLRKTPICWSFSFGWSYTVIFQSLGESEDPLLPFLSPSSSLSLSSY